MKTLPFVFLAILFAASLHARDKPDAAKTQLPGRLSHIIFPHIEFRQATVAEGLNFFQRKINELDVLEPGSPRQEIKLIYRGGIQPTILEHAKVTLSLRNIPASDALHYFALLAHLQTVLDPDGHTVAFIDLPAAQEAKDDPLDPNLGGNNRALTAKLNTIIIPNLEVRDAVVPEALDIMRQKCNGLDTAEADPASRGINIIYAPASKGTRLSLAFTQTSAMDLLRAIATKAGLKITIDPHAVLLEPAESK